MSGVGHIAAVRAHCKYVRSRAKIRPARSGYAGGDPLSLAGNGSGSVADQLLLVNEDRYTPTGPDQTPTGDIAPVEYTPLDFRQMMPIGIRLHSAFQQWQ
jgi:hypothetical protein